MPTFYAVTIWKKWKKDSDTYTFDNENVDGTYGPDPIAQAMALVDAVKMDETVIRIIVAKTDIRTFGKIVHNWER